MSGSYKTRFEIQKILSKAIESGLRTYIGQDHGFDIMEFAQATFQKADRVVLYNFLRVRNLGWNRVNYEQIDDGYRRKDETLEQQHWALHVILKRSKNPSIEDQQAEDVASLLCAYFNGPGCDELRKYGISCERIDSGNILVYNDDSELYQKRAVFTIKLQVPKVLIAKAESLEAVLPKIKPV